METSIAGPEAHSSLSPAEETHCHKARIFSVLTKAPVVRAWKGAICDGAVYLGKGSFPLSYADRYFQASREDICYVTFSIVTVFKEAGIDRSHGDILPAQCRASEFLIVTFYNDHDKVALLPRRLYWPVEGDESIGKYEAFVIDISAATLFPYCISIDCLLAHIEEIRRMTMNPMHPTTTPFQIGVDGRIPRADTPEAIMPQVSGPQMSDSDQVEERSLRALHKVFQEWGQNIKIDFLDFQPLLRDFKMVVSRSDEFPHGLEPVISHIVRDSSEYIHSSYDLRHADYLLTQATKHFPNYNFFVPRRLIRKDWFIAPRPHESMPKNLYDFDRPVNIKEFILNMDDAGTFIKDVWNIIRKYPPGPNPTPAEEKQEIWKKALPWPDATVAQAALNKDLTPQKARNDSGTGDGGAVTPSDTSLLAAHYSKKISLADGKREDDAI